MYVLSVKNVAILFCATNNMVVCFLLGNSPKSKFYVPKLRNTLFHLHRRLWRWNRQSVPKRWHIKFRRWGVTQKKAYNIQNRRKF